MAVPRKIEESAPMGGVALTPAQARARRQRNVAIGLAVAFLCLLFYAVTLAKLGASVFARAM